jgi:hypothetical protein
MIDPSEEVITGVPQLSVAVAAPGAGTPDGLHPRFAPVGQKVITGEMTSLAITVFIQVLVQDPLPTTKVRV